jgi:hypothetical protein
MPTENEVRVLVFVGSIIGQILGDAKKGWLLRGIS